MPRQNPGRPGVEVVALADQPLLGDVGWNNFISIDGPPPNGVLVNMLSVSPGWLETMKIPLVGGRDLLPSDFFPGSALVSQSFARIFLNCRECKLQPEATLPEVPTSDRCELRDE